MGFGDNVARHIMFQRSCLRLLLVGIQTTVAVLLQQSQRVGCDDMSVASVVMLTPDSVCMQLITGSQVPAKFYAGFCSHADMSQPL